MILKYQILNRVAGGFSPPAPSRVARGEFHPQALTDPDVSLSTHPAPHVPPQLWGLRYSQVPPISG